MVKKAPDDKPAAGQQPRETRLKAALKANMARRKAQLRARRQAAGDGDDTDNDNTDDNED
jgi:hypothetical protein